MNVKNMISSFVYLVGLVFTSFESARPASVSNESVLLF
jgi:hypothetical protein